MNWNYYFLPLAAISFSKPSFAFIPAFLASASPPAIFPTPNFIAPDAILPTPEGTADILIDPIPCIYLMLCYTIT